MTPVGSSWGAQKYMWSERLDVASSMPTPCHHADQFHDLHGKIASDVRYSMHAFMATSLEPGIGECVHAAVMPRPEI